MITRRYGWRPSLPALDAPVFRAPRAGALPSSVDLRPHMPPVYDQGALGSCVDNAVAGLIQYDELKQGLPSVTPSRLFLYYGARTLEGTVASDSGSSVADGLKSAARWGYCPEADWPYDPTRFAVQPSAACYAAAKANALTDYAQVPQTAEDLKAALAAGKPVAFGFTVYQSFESQQVAKTGIVPMPQRGERQLGGHCVALAGYDDAKGMYLVRNSWGLPWGLAGYCWFPYQLVEGRIASDFWAVNTVPGGIPTPTPTPTPAPTPYPTRPAALIAVDANGVQVGYYLPQG